jgi:hypothetical protein
LQDPVLVADVEPSPNGFVLARGFISGTWRVSAALRFTEALTSCKRDAVYESVRARLCGLADLAAGSSDRTRACDSLSFTMGFDSREARFTGTGGAPANTCQPSSEDTCLR